MELRKTTSTCLVALALSLGATLAFAQGTGNTGNPSNDPSTVQNQGAGTAAPATDGMSGGAGNTGNPNNDPALIQQDATGTVTGNGTTGGTGSTGNQTNDPGAIQSNGGSPCPSGTMAMKNAAGQSVCQ